MSALHVTCGDHAALLLERLGAAPRALPWRDVLHEGPVPAGLSREELRAWRAAFIAASGWADRKETLSFFRERDAAVARAAAQGVTLWFEPDLYDQLQLLEVLDVLALAGAAPGSIQVYTGPGFQGGDRAGLESALRPLDAAGLQAARRAWAAFRAPDPTELSRLAHADFPGLPHLAPALRRLLEEYPGVGDGLSRLERTLLQAAARGARDGAALFEAAAGREERRFLGDTACWLVLERLLAGASPLLEGGEGASFPARRVRLTEAGRRCLAGGADRMRLGAPERWLGGVRLCQGGAPDWRYHQDTATVAPARGPGAMP